MLEYIITQYFSFFKLNSDKEDDIIYFLFDICRKSDIIFCRIYVYLRV